ncbi:MAG: hypothetical protein ABSF22_15705 [Bryobacteraceae bacterium]
MASSPFEQFALPHTFQPRLSLYGAFLAVTGALTQILLGCLIAALWGVRIWLAVASAHSMVWKSFATFGLAVGMAASLGILIWSVRALIRRIS